MRLIKAFLPLSHFLSLNLYYQQLRQDYIVLMKYTLVKDTSEHIVIITSI